MTSVNSRDYNQISLNNKVLIVSCTLGTKSVIYDCLPWMGVRLALPYTTKHKTRVVQREAAEVVQTRPVSFAAARTLFDLSGLQQYRPIIRQ